VGDWGRTTGKRSKTQEKKKRKLRDREVTGKQFLQFTERIVPSRSLKPKRSVSSLEYLDAFKPNKHGAG
jgi:hypothetical protein